MGLPCFPFILLELFMSLNACLDIKWAIIYVPLHGWILNGLSLFSFHTFGIIHVP